MCACLRFTTVFSPKIRETAFVCPEALPGLSGRVSPKPMMVANAFDSRLFSPPKPEVAKPGSGFMAPFVYRDPRAYLAAVERGDIRSAMAQLDAGVDIDSMTADGDSALANAVYQGHGLLAAHLIERGADPNFANKQIGDTVLMWAAVSGNLRITDLLLRSGANVNAENKMGYRALYRAASKGHVEIVKMLLVAGAEPRAKTALKPPKTALDGARLGGFKDVVEVLMRWEDLSGQEAIKMEYPSTASNFVADRFINGATLSRKLSGFQERKSKE